MAKDLVSFQGKCLCGAVTIRFQHDQPTLSACHCSMCRNWSGGPNLSVEGYNAPSIEGLEHVRSYQSSEWAERSFCSVCGTHLFYRLLSGEFYSLSVGLFKEGAHWPFKLQVYIDEKPGNYQFANKTREMTGEEVVKLFS